MTILTEDTDKIFRCECGGPHFISIRYMYFEDEPACAWLSIEEAWNTSRDCFWGRIKAAWTVFRGRHFVGSELELSPGKALEVAQELLSIAERVERASHR